MLKKRLIPLDRESTNPSGRALRTETALFWAQLRAVIGSEGEQGLRLGVVSAAPSVAVAAVAANLAIFLARRGKRVALIESIAGDERLADHFGVSGGPGFAELVSNAAPIQSISHTVTEPSFLFVPGTATVEELGELSLDPEFDRFLSALEPIVDLMLVIAPPVFGSSQSPTLLERMDTNVLVVPAGQAHTRDVQRSVKVMRELSLPLAGSVLADVEYHVPALIARWI